MLESSFLPHGSDLPMSERSRTHGGSSPLPAIRPIKRANRSRQPASARSNRWYREAVVFDGDELRPALHEVRDEGNVASEPVKLRDLSVALWRLQVARAVC